MTKLYWVEIVDGNNDAPVVQGRAMTGRPFRSSLASTRRTFRATDAEWSQWKKAARAEKKNVSEWLREMANKHSAWILGAEALARERGKDRK